MKGEMKLLPELGNEASGPGGVEQVSFVDSALRELTGGLCRGNFLMYAARLWMLAMCSGAEFLAGMRVLTDEYGG
jgi:hypothetical protein